MKKTLIDLIQADISRTVDAGPDWVQIVEDAVLRQDMEWLADADALQRPGAAVGPDRT